MDFINANWQIVAVFAALLIAVFFGTTGSLKSKVFALLYYGVLKAESTFGGKTGAVKKAAVLAWVRAQLPSAVRWVITESTLDYLLERGVAKMKAMLADNTDIDLEALADSFVEFL